MDHWVDCADDLVSHPWVPVPFAILRGSITELRTLFASGAEQRFAEPPLPFVALQAFDTPNADHLGALFLESTEVALGPGESWGGALFDRVEVVFTSPDHSLYVARIPRQLVDGVVGLDADAIESRARSLYPLNDRIPINPFTKKPMSTLEAHETRILQAQAAIARESRALRSLPAIRN